MLIRKISNVIAFIMFVVFWIAVSALDSATWVPLIIAIGSFGYLFLFAKARGWCD